MKLLLAWLLWIPAAGFSLARMAVVIGNDTGLADEKPLSFATRDARQVYQALSDLGGADKGRGYLLLDPDVSKVRASFREARTRIHALRTQGEKSQILIYFSGHGSPDALHMNGEKLPLDEIRAYFRDLDADLKLLVADACFSGSLIQAKGAALAPPVDVVYADELKVNGSAILTSSSAGELSQESRELQGSLFTHYFLSALRGAADYDRDAQITLWEAYTFTRAHLRRKLAAVRNATQNPGFDVDIQGSDNVVLSRVELGRAFLALKGLPEGEYRVLESANSVQVAVVDLADPEGAVLALPRSDYRVYRSEGAAVSIGSADLRRWGTVALGPGDFHPLPRGGLAAKGAPGIGRSGPYGPPLQISAQSRYYPSFPGGAGAMAFAASFQGHRREWSLAGSFDYLPGRRILSGGNVLEQNGYGVAGELRYVRMLPLAGAVSVGPRCEAWSLGQILNGRGYPRAALLGTFAALGLERNLFGGLSLSATVEGGGFWTYDPSGRPVRIPAFPMSLALRFRP